MTIFEKIERLKIIPKLIAEKEEGRERLKSIKAMCYERSSGFQVADENSSEKTMLNYVDNGNEIDELKLELKNLINEMQQEIDSILPGEDIVTVDKRRILKAYYLDHKSLKNISNRLVYRSYPSTKEIFNAGFEEIKIAHEKPKKTVR